MRVQIDARPLQATPQSYVIDAVIIMNIRFDQTINLHVTIATSWIRGYIEILAYLGPYTYFVLS